jgi:beta-galactosidase
MGDDMADVGDQPGSRAGGLGRSARRSVLRTGLVGGAVVAAALLARDRATPLTSVPAVGTPRRTSFNTGWLFGGEYVPGSEAAGYDDRAFTPVVLPHTVVPLSWGGWDPTTWQRVWIYRRHLSGTEFEGSRVIVDFDGVMTSATAYVNGQPAGSHKGGYLPWSLELTDYLDTGDNVLALVVDARCLAVPPVGPGHGPDSVDYLQPGGIYRDVTLRAVPQVHLADVFARPAGVLTRDRRVDVQCTVDAAVEADEAQLAVELLDGSFQLATATRTVSLPPGTSTVLLQLSGLDRVNLWSPTEPQLYTVRVTLSVPGADGDQVTRRIGFREASFRPDGFYLNGNRLKIFGLNRHQLYPYTGMAMSARLQRRDAEILRYELNCNMVRCSHYPQSPHFLDACDEIGLMVWEETPGWQQLGDRAWQDMVVQNVRDMVVRDRSRPSVIIWGTRLDESGNNPALYTRTHRTAHDLDGSRPTTGATLRHSTVGWTEDVLGFDDYHAGGDLRPPLTGVPYLISEAVGALDGSPTYRWTDPAPVLASQARLHAWVHHQAGSDHRYAGLLGWAGIDYASHNGGHRVWNALKTPGVLDTFRITKPGAALYQSQVDPGSRPVVLPTFYWDFGPGSPPNGPGPDAMIATNCERLEIFVNGQHVGTAVPDTTRFGGLRYPPAFADLASSGAGLPDLRIDGYVNNRKVATVQMSADPARDRLALTVEDTAITADGSDTTRVTFRAVDAYGNHRPTVVGDVTLGITGPGTLVSENPFPFGRYGAAGAAFVRSLPGRTGIIRVTADHPTLGHASVQLTSGTTPTTKVIPQSAQPSESSK